MTGDAPELRCSDADRERVAAQLREHYAQGRLTLEEFDERTTAAYAAKTFGDLVPLTADLPVPQQPARPPDRLRSSVPWTPIVIGLVVAVLVVVPAIVGAVTGGDVQYGMPVWLLAFVLIGIGRRRCRVGPHHGRRDGGSGSVTGQRQERDPDDGR